MSFRFRLGVSADGRSPESHSECPFDDRRCRKFTHTVPAENPDAYDQAVLTFLSKH